jgi:Fe-S cluster assembly scaffold protein SufB
MPTWGADLTGLEFDDIKYFVRSTEKQAASWDDVLTCAGVREAGADLVQRQDGRTTIRPGGKADQGSRHARRVQA